MKSDFVIALTQLAAERNLPREMVLSAIEVALASAYKKDHLANDQNIAVRLNPSTGDVRVRVLMTTVEEVADPRTEICLPDARKVNPDAQPGDIVQVNSIPYTPGRIAAQTAKQVVLQRLREAQRDLVFAEFADRTGEVVTATVQRMEPRQITVDLGRAEGVLPEREQVTSERYRVNQKIKVYIADVIRSTKGPEIIVSRGHKDLLRRLFELEVPEIYNGIVEMKSIAREPGSRSKVAVHARQEGVDAVGSCVGLRGIRIQNVVNELQGEKIDVVQWSRDPAVFISNSLNPAQISRVEIKEVEGSARVVVQDKQLSLAIGKEGQNARLAARLTGWKIDILSATEVEEERLEKAATAAQLEATRGASTETEAEAVATTEGETQETEAVPGEGEPTAHPPEVAEPVAHEETEQPVAEAPAAQEEEVVASGAEEDHVPEPASAEMSAEEQEEWLARAIREEEAAQTAEAGEAQATGEERPEEGEAEEEAEEEEEEGAIPMSDDIWQVPQLVPSMSGQIRFAEDIMGPRPEGGGRGRRKRGSNRGGQGRGRRAKGGKRRGQR